MAGELIFMVQAASNVGVIKRGAFAFPDDHLLRARSAAVKPITLHMTPT